MFREHEGYIGQVGEEDGGVVDGHFFLLTHDVLYDLRDDVQGEEGIVEFGDSVVGFEIGGDLFDDFADVSRKIAHDLGLMVIT